jgi:anti-sigma factor RsiW
MNCRRLQHRLYEYLEGTLSRGAQAAAERHLSGCAACRQALERERQIAQTLAGGFRRATASLRLPPEVQRRVRTALAEERSAAQARHSRDFSWLRSAWPQALAASLLLLLAGLFFFARTPAQKTASPQPPLSRDEVLVQHSYVVPAYTFRREEGFVVDALIYQTNTVHERFPVVMARLE